MAALPLHITKDSPRWSQRYGPVDPDATQVWDGTVADLQAGDYLPGGRQEVIATGATTAANKGSLRTLTLRRWGEQRDVQWFSGAPIRFIR